MPISPEKRAANKRNALKSTGPRTASGRRISAQNATRHGLSVSLPTHLVEPVQQQLVQLIMSDGFDHGVANNLAEKIIEYERNILYLNDIFINETILPYDSDDKKGAAIRQKKERQGQFVDTLKNIEQHELKIENREGLYPHEQKLLQTLNRVKRAGIRMIQLEKMFDVYRVADSQRYFKRASNQLIKALRRL